MSDSVHVSNMVGQESISSPSIGHESREIRRPCIRSLYCKALICTSAIASFGLFMFFLIQCLETKTYKDKIYSSVAAGVSIALSVVLSGIVICYRRREIDGCWLFTEFLRRHLETVRNNNPYRVVNFEDAGDQSGSGLENTEDQITQTNTGNNDKNAEDGKNGACKLLTHTSGEEGGLAESSSSSTACKVSEVASSVSLIASAAAAEAGEAVKISESTEPKEVPSTTGSKTDESSSAVAPLKSPYVISFVEYDSNDDFEYI